VVQQYCNVVTFMPIYTFAHTSILVYSQQSCGEFTLRD
jgi:hypothetical protein